MGKILVTGGAGFIGSHIAEELVRQGDEVTALDDLSGGFTDNLVERVTFVQGSINDVELVNRLFAEECYGAVFHLAAYAAEGLSHFIKRFNYTNNLLGSVNLLNASVRTHVKCFVFTSREIAEAVFKKHGALRQVECWGDDVPEGKLTSFSIALQRKDDEVAVFSWIEWASKEARDKGNAAAMEEFSKMTDMTPDKMPFDGKRMFWGGFQPILDERR